MLQTMHLKGVGPCELFPTAVTLERLNARVYEHVLLQILNSGESDSTGWTLKRPIRAVGARAARRTDIQVIWILNTFQFFCISFIIFRIPSSVGSGLH